MTELVLQDQQFMECALQQANLAATQNEVPVGAVLVKNNKIIVASYNNPITNLDPTAHAEIVALRAAAKLLGNYRLLDTTLYVTLEPCAMCLGAMQHARIKRCVYGASDPKTGVLGGCCNLLKEKWALHKMQITSGVLADACGELLKDFFRDRRGH
jgi:tRNA(adenine34) deaminase